MNGRLIWVKLKPRIQKWAFYSNSNLLRKFVVGSEVPKPHEKTVFLDQNAEGDGIV